MSKAEGGRRQSMEEILASIRRLLAEGGGGQSARPPAAAREGAQDARPVAGQDATARTPSEPSHTAARAAEAAAGDDLSDIVDTTPKGEAGPRPGEAARPGDSPRLPRDPLWFLGRREPDTDVQGRSEPRLSEAEQERTREEDLARLEKLRTPLPPLFRAPSEPVQEGAAPERPRSPEAGLLPQRPAAGPAPVSSPARVESETAAPTAGPAPGAAEATTARDSNATGEPSVLEPRERARDSEAVKAAEATSSVFENIPAQAAGSQPAPGPVVAPLSYELSRSARPGSAAERPADEARGAPLPAQEAMQAQADLLAQALTAKPDGEIQARALEDLVTRLLRPLLREWLDANLPRLVEAALRQELAAGAKPKIGSERP
jgi:cell pole-organizing protein PopZ